MTQAFQIAPGQVGDKTIQAIAIAGRASHGSDVPFAVGSISFNPDDYALAGAATVFTFEAIAANGITPLTTTIELYNVTDAELVASSTLSVIDTTAQVLLSAVLVAGVAAGELKTGAQKIYECRIKLSAPSGSSNDTVELYSAKMVVTHTVL